MSKLIYFLVFTFGVLLFVGLGYFISGREKS